MSLRDDLAPVVDDARAIVAGLGLRPYVVRVRTRTWPGAPGVGTPTVTTLTIEPPPRVRAVPDRLTMSSSGTFEQGDRRVDRVSTGYTRDQLLGPAGAQTRWLLEQAGDAVEFEPVAAELSAFGWEVTLRRTKAPR